MTQTMEEEPMTRSLLLNKKLDNKGECSEHDCVDAALIESSSSITFMLVFSTVITVCGSFTYGNAMGYTSPAESGILDDLSLSLAEYSLFGSMLTIGGLAGAVCCGKIADLIGRKGAMWVSNAFCITGWLAITLSKGAWSLDLGRLLLGFGVALVAYVVPIYIGEVTPKNLRGAFMSLNSFMMSSGISVTFIIGSFLNWRALAIVGIVPCLVQVLGLFFIPESPRWLAKFGREKGLEAALKRLRGKSSNISNEAAEIIDYTEKLNQIAEDGIGELFQQKYAYAAIVGSGLMLLQQFGGLSGYAYYLSSILDSAGFPASVGSVATSVAQLVASIFSFFLIDRFGRRPLLMVSASGMCLGSFMTGLSFLLQDHHLWKEVSPILAMLGVMVFVGSMSIGMGGIPWIIVSEIFPINVKGSAGSFANLINWSGSWLVSYTFNFIFEWSSAGVFFIYSSIAGFGIIFVAMFVPETKGRTLEEIQASIS